MASKTCKDSGELSVASWKLGFLTKHQVAHLQMEASQRA